MSNSSSASMVFYDRLMRQKPGYRGPKEDGGCIGCPNHRPKWKYRFCVYIECPYIKGMTTFREEFREED